LFRKKGGAKRTVVKEETPSENSEREVEIIEIKEEEEGEGEGEGEGEAKSSEPILMPKRPQVPSYPAQLNPL
jgi:hypothetical protein